MANARTPLRDDEAPVPAPADVARREADPADVTVVEDDQLVEDDLLVEDISIDGMCGVY